MSRKTQLIILFLFLFFILTEVMIRWCDEKIREEVQVNECIHEIRTDWNGGHCVYDNTKLEYEKVGSKYTYICPTCGTEYVSDKAQAYSH
jgi:hypothetical protein